jgi:hypothetical protein
MIEALFSPSGETDEYGAMIFYLEIEDQKIECISGLPGYSPCPPWEDSPGSCRPIPEGEYLVGNHFTDPIEGCNPAIGPDWIELEPQTNIGRRNNLLIHRDWNWIDSPGTAGCIAPLRHADMDHIIKGLPKGSVLIVDYGFGSI